MGYPQTIKNAENTKKPDGCPPGFSNEMQARLSETSK